MLISLTIILSLCICISNHVVHLKYILYFKFKKENNVEKVTGETRHIENERQIGNFKEISTVSSLSLCKTSRGSVEQGHNKVDGKGVCVLCSQGPIRQK